MFLDYITKANEFDIEFYNSEQDFSSELSWKKKDLVFEFLSELSRDLISKLFYIYIFFLYPFK